MENYNTIWHIELYDEYGEHVGDEYFARKEAAKQYIETNKKMWQQENLTWNIGGETLWLQVSDTMEKMIYVKNIDVNEVNDYLEKGWKVKLITSVAQNIALGGKGFGPDRGLYGAYVVLEKEDK